MIADIASDQVIDQAWLWLGKAGNGSHYNNDVWHLHFHWLTEKSLIQQQLHEGEYPFSPYAEWV